MNIKGWLELALFIVVLVLITKPLGIYLLKVLDVNERTLLDPVLKPVERITYRLFGIDPQKEQGWIGYTISILVFSVVGALFSYLIMRFQDLLPLNPQKFPGVTDHIAFNTALSFLTNTNWQSYAGEST